MTVMPEANLLGGAGCAATPAYVPGGAFVVAGACDLMAAFLAIRWSPCVAPLRLRLEAASPGVQRVRTALPSCDVCDAQLALGLVTHPPLAASKCIASVAARARDATTGTLWATPGA